MNPNSVALQLSMAKTSTLLLLRRSVDLSPSFSGEKFHRTRANAFSLVFSSSQSSPRKHLVQGSVSPKFTSHFELEDTGDAEQSKFDDVLKILKRANSFIPHIVLASTVLALVYPRSFTWFTTRITFFHVFAFSCILTIGIGALVKLQIILNNEK